MPLWGGGASDFLTTSGDTEKAIAFYKNAAGVSDVEPTVNFQQLPGFATCGAACAAKMGQSFGADVTEQQLINAGLGYTASSAGKISEVFNDVTGMKSVGGSLPQLAIDMSDQELLATVNKYTQSGQTPFMMLYGWGQSGHWVLATGTTDAGLISIMDPVGASYNVTTAYLRGAWKTGDVVIGIPGK